MVSSFRPLAKDEKAALLASIGGDPASSRSLVSTVAYYGSFLVLIPIIGGGLIGRILHLAGLPLTPSYLTGILLASATSPILFLRAKRRHRESRTEWTRRRRTLEALDQVPTLTVALDQGWYVESEPDWPSFLFRSL